MNRASFYASLRKRGSGVFGTSLSQKQVEGIESSLDYAEKHKVALKHLAYILATDYHEGGATMQPVMEKGPRRYFDMYEPNTAKGRRLGNEVMGDGYKYRGRSKPQVTGLGNMRKVGKFIGVDAVNNPDVLMDLKVATIVLFRGVLEGWWTGKKLSDYSSYKPMRQTVNGMDKAGLIAGYAVSFETALRAADYGLWPGAKPSAPPIKPNDSPPAVDYQKPPETIIKPASVAPVEHKGWLAALFAFIFRRKS